MHCYSISGLVQRFEEPWAGRIVVAVWEAVMFLWLQMKLKEVKWLARGHTAGRSSCFPGIQISSQTVTLSHPSPGDLP